MTKITLNDLSTISGNEQSAINLINANNATIETASDNTLSRDGTSPNQMLSSLDMNSFRILNLSDAINLAEPVTYGQFLSLITSAGIPITASYITLGTDSILTNERVLTAGSGITLTDGGAGSTLTISSSGTPTGAALTKVNDTNVTLTLGGTPTTALLQATSITAGWTGTLSEARGGTGIGALGTGIATWLGTPSSANLASAITDETGTGSLVFGTAPTFTTSLTSPLVIGGTAVGSSLTLKSTSGVGTTDTIIFQVGNNGAKEGFRIVTGGQVVQGHTAAVDLGAGVVPTLQLHTLTGGSLLGQTRWSADAFGSFISLSKSRGATVSSFTIVQNSDVLGTLIFRGMDGSVAVNAAAIACLVDGTPGSSDMPGRLVFQTTPDGSPNLVERLRIDNAGNVIVNTAAIATNATDGFLYIPTCAGTPTGVPTTYTGRVALVYDTTNNKFYIYNGAWKGGTAPGVWS